MPKQEMCKIVRDTIYKQGIFGIDYHHYQIKFRIVQEMPTGSTTVYESQIFSLDKSEQEWTRLRARLLAEGWKLVESTYRHGEEMYTREIPDN